MTMRQKTSPKIVKYAHKMMSAFEALSGIILSEKAPCGCKNKLQIADKRHKKHQKRLKKRKNKRKTATFQILCNLMVAATGKSRKRHETPHFCLKMPEKSKIRTKRQKCSEKSTVLPLRKLFAGGKPYSAPLDFEPLI